MSKFCSRRLLHIKSRNLPRTLLRSECVYNFVCPLETLEASHCKSDWSEELWSLPGCGLFQDDHAHIHRVQMFTKWRMEMMQVICFGLCSNQISRQLVRDQSPPPSDWGNMFCKRMIFIPSVQFQKLLPWSRSSRGPGTLLLLFSFNVPTVSSSM